MVISYTSICFTFDLILTWRCNQNQSKIMFTLTVKRILQPLVRRFRLIKQFSRVLFSWCSWQVISTQTPLRPRQVLSPTVSSNHRDHSDSVRHREIAAFISRGLHDLDRICTHWAHLELNQSCLTRSQQIHRLHGPEESTYSGSQDTVPSLIAFNSVNSIRSNIAPSHGRSSTCTVKMNPLMTHLAPSLCPFEFNQEALFEQFWPTLLSHWSTRHLLKCEESVQRGLISGSPKPTWYNIRYDEGMCYFMLSVTQFPQYVSC